MHWVSNHPDESVPVSLHILHDEEGKNLARVQDACAALKIAQEIQVYLLHFNDILLSIAELIRSFEIAIYEQNLEGHCRCDIIHRRHPCTLFHDFSALLFLKKKAAATE